MLITKDDVGRKVWHITKGWGKITEYKSEKPGVKNPRVDCTFDIKGYGMTTYDFNTDGRYTLYDNLPSIYWNEIQIYEPPKPKRIVKKKVEVWLNVYNEYTSEYVYKTKEEADKRKDIERTACVKVSGEYEIEED